MSTVIDEQGNAQTWTAVYWRHYAQRTHEAGSLADALRFLSYGEDAGSLSSQEVRGPDGSVVIGEDEIFDAINGRGRWATPDEAAARELIAAVEQVPVTTVTIPWEPMAGTQPETVVTR